MVIETFTRKLRGLKSILHFDNKWQLLLDRTLFKKTRLNVYRLGDLEFVVDHSAGDASGVRKCITSPMYKDLLSRIPLNDALSVLDIGAHAGGFALMLRSAGYSIRRLACIEMNPHTFRRLEFNISRNFGLRPVCVNAALCGRKRTIELALSIGRTSDSIYDRNGSEETDGESVSETTSIEGWTFDAIYNSIFSGDDEIVDICKIDVEGAEYEVFLSVDGHERLRNCRFLMMEIHERSDSTRTGRLLQVIERLGFETVVIAEEEDVFLFGNKNTG